MPPEPRNSDNQEQDVPEEQSCFEEEVVTPLSDRDRDAFLAALGDPPAANEAFRRAAERYKRHADHLPD